MASQYRNNFLVIGQYYCYWEELFFKELYKIPNENPLLSEGVPPDYDTLSALCSTKIHVCVFLLPSSLEFAVHVQEARGK